ncbi:hypothetical protein LG198_08790 [Methylobacillus arboreus]|uniref:YobI family P-loop NTPase n=1 Tax=Methylobacillus arboreus TaxID=755170 RepID=UPI001E4E8D89|nr:hypothetical protein [Methylobacillus arboreus]MCB5190820.1 hypothetical protein [Methylobacillus arboreus]
MSDASHENAPSLKLVPLTPEYLENEHGVYVEAINTAIKDKNVRNIALSGNYGVGKSSILQKVAQQHKDRVVELSLSTLAPIETTALNSSVPQQATTQTNRIQQEIVKQLLYREEPHKTPGSRFQRIERFRWSRELPIAGLAGLVVAVVFLLTGWSEKIASALPLLNCIGLWAHLFILAIAATTVGAIRYLFHGHLYIGQLSAGSAAITLDKKSASYFDQYLDEIVYFFEISGRDILIFEDIDRFDDALIFETLRSLNTLLNSSPQIKKNICFIYAIKDSIFDRANLEQDGRRNFRQSHLNITDSAQAEVVRANRTKFFDIVIPVVPFITHRSAKDITARLLQEIKHTIDTGLIDLASRHVPDMRLLKNVRNEFIVFRERIFSGSGKELKLSETELFAMMLYKSTHMTDFEAIRLGRSKLDQLYEMSRRLVVTNTQHIENEVRQIQKKLAHIDGIAANSASLGDKLIAHIQRTMRAVGYQSQNGNFSFNGTTRTENDFKTQDFWIEFTKKSDDAVLLWQSPQWQHPHYKLTFMRTDLAAALNSNLDFQYWDNAYRKELEENLQEQRATLNFLRTADMGDLIKCPDLLIEYGSDNKKQTLDSITRQLLDNGLAYQLIRAGYINRNFTLYTSTFQGDRVSTAATNFIIHHVERNVMDEYFELEGNDVDAIIRECGKNSLKESALYNIAILDHLLRNDEPAADTMIRSLIQFGENEKRFLQAYLSNTNEEFKFIRHFVKATPKAFLYLINDVALEEPLRLSLVSNALENLADTVKYQTDATVEKYLAENYAELPALTSIPLSASQAQRIAKLFSQSSIQVPALDTLLPQVQQTFVSRDLYEVNRQNLMIAVGSDANLSLNGIRSANEDIYQHVMNNLSAYLIAINGNSTTVDSESEFISVIEDVLVANADLLSEVIAQASGHCAVIDLDDVSESAWPLLAFHKRFPATLHNVSLYIGSVGTIDTYLAGVLVSEGRIAEYKDVEEEDKVQLAKTILAASNYMAASVRAELAKSLALEEYLNVDEIPAEKGDLYLLLIKAEVIADDSDTYTRLLETDWPTRERIIESSTKFKNYVTPELLQGDLATLLRSDKVSLDIKTEMVKRADEYFANARKEELIQLAHFAVQHECQVSLQMVTKLATHGISAVDVIVFLKPHLETILSEQLFAILQLLGAPYSQLTSVGQDQPKIPDTQGDRALAETLQSQGIVSKFTIDENMLRIYKKHK